MLEILKVYIEKMVKLNIYINYKNQLYLQQENS